MAGIEWVSSQTTPRAGGPELDARVLALTEDRPGGRRHREWSSVARSMSQLDMANWPVDGPRSARLVVEFLGRAASGGPENYHRWWRTVCKLTVADWGVAEHNQLCRYLFLAGTYDQYDMSNSAMLEAVCRRLQLVEYQYRERSRENQLGGGRGGSASGALAGSLPLGAEEADLFVGVGRLDGVVCVAPHLVEWISRELAKTAEIDKQARKAREEKALLRGLEYNLPSPPVPEPAKKGDKKGKGDNKGG